MCYKSSAHNSSVNVCFCSEVGTALPQADSQQEAVILMLKKRVDKLLRKLEEAEKDYQSHLVDG